MLKDVLFKVITKCLLMLSFYKRTTHFNQVGASVCVIFSSNATCFSLLLSVRFLTSPKPGPYFGICNDNSYFFAHEPGRALCTDFFHLGRSCAFSTCRTAKEPFVADTLGAALPPGRRLDGARHAQRTVRFRLMPAQPAVRTLCVPVVTVLPGRTQPRAPRGGSPRSIAVGASLTHLTLVKCLRTLRGTPPPGRAETEIKHARKW